MSTPPSTDPLINRQQNVHLIIPNTLFNYDLRYGNMSIKSKLDEHCNFASEAVNGSPACKKYIFDKKICADNIHYSMCS